MFGKKHLFVVDHRHWADSMLLRWGSDGPSNLRIGVLLRRSCRCHRKGCFTKLARVRGVLLEFLTAFWGMSKHAQDEYLKQVIGPGKQWYLLGQQMAAKCVIAAIGLGNNRMARVSKGHVDRRFKVWGLEAWLCLNRNVEIFGVFVTMHFVFPQLVHHRIDSEVQPKPAVKTRLINQFLLSMYIKAGGMLPERWLGLAKATIIYFYCGRIRESLISLVPFFLQRQVSSWRKAQEEPSTETHCYFGWWVPATWRKREPLSFCRW